jgi:hypothetical protein
VSDGNKKLKKICMWSLLLWRKRLHKPYFNPSNYGLSQSFLRTGIPIDVLTKYFIKIHIKNET